MGRTLSTSGSPSLGVQGGQERGSGRSCGKNETNIRTEQGHRKYVSWGVGDTKDQNVRKEKTVSRRPEISLSSTPFPFGQCEKGGFY